MLDCRRCKNWRDESFAQLYEESSHGQSDQSVFYGCTIYGLLEEFQREACDRYEQCDELFAVCSTCGIAVPKVCLSLGECVNCTDTDLFCVDTCRGEGEKKFCSHYQRLRREGHTLIENNEYVEVFPDAEPGAAALPDATPIIELFPVVPSKPDRK